MTVRVQIRKRDRIPERCTGAYDAACCMQNDCESCSCCEDWMATFGNPLLVLELGRMLMHVVHADKHERYVECSPYGTHYDPDVEAAMPLNNAAMPPNNAYAYAAPVVTNTQRNRTVPTGTTLEMTAVAPQVVAPVQAQPPRFDINTGQPITPVPQAPKPAFDVNTGLPLEAL